MTRQNAAVRKGDDLRCGIALQEVGGVEGPAHRVGSAEARPHSFKLLNSSDSSPSVGSVDTKRAVEARSRVPAYFKAASWRILWRSASSTFEPLKRSSHSSVTSSRSFAKLFCSARAASSNSLFKREERRQRYTSVSGMRAMVVREGFKVQLSHLLAGGGMLFLRGCA